MKQYVVILLIVSVVFGVPELPFSISSDYILVFERLNDRADRMGEIIPFNLNQPGRYMFILAGAQGGSSSIFIGGRGSIVKGEFIFNNNDDLQIYIVVGKSGESSDVTSPGGGGGSFIYNKRNKLLLAAGGGGGASVYSHGNPASATDVARDATHSTISGLCLPDENCLGKGGETSQYGGYPRGPCSSNDTKTDCTCAGGIGMGWSSKSFEVPGFINFERSGKPGNNYSNINEPFFGGLGGKWSKNGGFGGYGGGGGGGGLKDGSSGLSEYNQDGSCGSGAGGGYSGGGSGVGRYSAGGGGSTFCGGNNCLKKIQNSRSFTGGLAVIYRSNSSDSILTGNNSDSPASFSTGSILIPVPWICFWIFRILN